MRGSKSGERAETYLNSIPEVNLLSERREVLFLILNPNHLVELVDFVVDAART